MGGNIPPDVFQAFREQQKAADARAARMSARTVLAEMVRQDVAEGRLSWRRRKAMVRFAERLGLDGYEAQLLIRAAEFGFDKNIDEACATTAREYLATLDEPARSWQNAWVMIGAVALNVVILMTWMRWRG